MRTSHFNEHFKHIQKHVYKFIDNDKIRLYKIIEMMQFAIIFLFLAIGLSQVMELIFGSKEEDIKKMSSWFVNLQLILIVFIYCVVAFYALKFAKMIPSLMHLLDRDFRPFTTLDYSLHVVFIVVFMDMNSVMYVRLKHLGYLPNNQEHKM